MEKERENEVPGIGDVTKMTLTEFAEIVKQMRHNQRRYNIRPTIQKFKTLQNWENKVDEIVRILTDKQLKLF